MIVLTEDYVKRQIVIDAGRNPSQELVTFDLSVGAIAEADKIEAREITKPYRLKPNHCIVVWTREALEVPDGIFGQICSRASLSARGLIVANTKVDPLFNGKLAITVFNAGGRALYLLPDQKFCSVFFHTLERQSIRGTRRHAPSFRIGARHWLREQLSLHWLNILGLITAAILGGLVTGLLQ